MIILHRLTKRYGAFTAVDQIGFEVRPGTVLGFLGPNGAGKSTALRMLVGLTPPTSGWAHVLGRPYAALPNPGRQVGVMLDASAQHGGRTGHESLLLSALTLGVSRSRVAQTLELVGLTPAESRRRIRDYSLGMRQRLGIANALLGEPEVLILDEPANGLDPAGIHWIRGLLRHFADRGGTVLMSSHLLREVEAVADEIAIIGRGRILAHGRPADLRPQASTTVDSTDNAELAAVLVRAGLSVSGSPGGPITVAADPATVGRLALEATATLTELRAVDGFGLEELFLTLTTDQDREAAA